jgi:hypothetical protein
VPDARLDESPFPDEPRLAQAGLALHDEGATCSGPQRRQRLGQHLWEGNSSRVPRRHLASDAWGMLDWLRLALIVLRAACRSRTDLVLENLLLRHQLAVLARPTRRRNIRLRRLDRLLWVLIRRVCCDWRRHLD